MYWSGIESEAHNFQYHRKVLWKSQCWHRLLPCFRLRQMSWGNISVEFSVSRVNWRNVLLVWLDFGLQNHVIRFDNVPSCRLPDSKWFDVNFNQIVGQKRAPITSHSFRLDSLTQMVYRSFLVPACGLAAHPDTTGCGADARDERKASNIWLKIQLETMQYMQTPLHELLICIATGLAGCDVCALCWLCQCPPHGVHPENNWISQIEPNFCGHNGTGGVAKVNRPQNSRNCRTMRQWRDSGGIGNEKKASCDLRWMSPVWLDTKSMIMCIFAAIQFDGKLTVYLYLVCILTGPDRTVRSHVDFIYI